MGLRVSGWLGAVAIVAASTLAHATSIAITNGNFETTGSGIPGWTIDSIFAQEYEAGGTHGSILDLNAYENNAGGPQGQVEQTLSADWAIGNYTLQLDIDGPFNYQGYVGPLQIALRNANTNAVIAVETWTPTDSNWHTITLQTSVLAAAAEIGAPINIQFTHEGTGDIDVDNVSLNDAAPALSVSPSSVSFGNVLVGGTAAASSFTVTNAGASGAPALTGTVTGTGTNGVSITSGGGSFSDAQGSGNAVGVGFAPTARGAGSMTASVSSNVGSQTVTVTGTGVAPVASTSSTGASYVRLGTSGTASVSITNTGDGNSSGVAQSISNLRGTVGAASGAFSGTGASVSLTDGSNQSVSYSYTPTAFGTQSSSVALSFADGSSNGANSALTGTASLSGIGVGPQFSSSVSPGNTINFGTVNGHGSANFGLTLTNTESQAGLAEALTGLTILSASFSGPQAGLFSLANWTGPVVLHDSTSLSDLLSILFSANSFYGNATATLTLVTDEDAAFGSAGESFSYTLDATVVPAPAPVATMAGLFTATLVPWCAAAKPSRAALSAGWRACKAAPPPRAAARARRLR